MTDYQIARTVGELIAILSEMDPSAVPMSHEPPFTGVKVVAQDNGKVMLASLWNTDEGRAFRATQESSGPIGTGGVSLTSGYLA